MQYVNNMYIYLYTYIYIYTYIYVYVHTYMCIINIHIYTLYTQTYIERRITWDMRAFSDTSFGAACKAPYGKWRNFLPIKRISASLDLKVG